jgi:hypothetical protein
MSKTEPDLWTAATSGGAYWDVVYRGSWQEASKPLWRSYSQTATSKQLRSTTPATSSVRWHVDGEEMKEVWSLLDLDPDEVGDAMIVDLS